MAAFIFDASGIVKRYLTEIGSGWVQGLTDPAAAHEILLSRITRVEIVAAITRRSRGGPVPATVAPALLAQFRHDAAHQYTILEVTPALLADAERLAEIHGLRAYDAVQLAAAADLHRERLANGRALVRARSPRNISRSPSGPRTSARLFPRLIAW